MRSAFLLTLLLAAGRSASTPAAAADTRTLREADLALARAVEVRDRAAFGALLEEEAWFGGAGAFQKGRTAVLAGWSDLFVEGGPRLRWTPELAELSASRDLGYTVGHYSLEVPAGSGQPVRREGRYLTLWRRGPDGAFRVAVDLSLSPPRQEGPARTVERTLASAGGDLVAEAGRLGEAAAPGGVYLVIRRRAPDGTLATALETVVKAPGAAAD